MTNLPASDGRNTERSHGPSSDPSGTGEGFVAWGVVHGSLGGVYTVLTDHGPMVEASLRGRVKRQERLGERVVIGDRVQVAPDGGAWTINEVEDRVTEMVRRGPGGRKPKVVAANLRHVFVVVAARDPDVHMELVDRLLVVAEAAGIRATVVINKADLEGAPTIAADLAAIYEPIGYDVLPVSAATGLGVAALAEQICGGTSAFIGPSGAGKSTLLNAVDPALGLRVGELSRKTGRGRHTTVSSRLIRLSCGGLVADTPGFSDVGLWGAEPENVAACFPEIQRLADACRFRGCAHEHEPECAVKAAVADGQVAPTRYRSYLRIRAEAVESALARRSQ